MRLACGLAIALGLSFPAAGMACQQDAAGASNAAGQTPAAPATRAVNAPADEAPTGKSGEEKAPAGQVSEATTPIGRLKAPESVAKKKLPAGSATGTRKRRKRAVPAPDGAPRKVVIREGGASEPAAQIAPGITPAEATRQRQNAEQLLGSADDQLKQLAGRTLDARQQETEGQIRNYMEGARSALKEGDVRRANTLAEKAHLLAEDLVKH